MSAPADRDARGREGDTSEVNLTTTGASNTQMIPETASSTSPQQAPDETLPGAADVAVFVEDEPPEEPLDIILGRVLIHADKPIEHLPELSPPELKIIGRCVTFTGDTTIDGESKLFHYEGLVGTINRDTVMLMHVFRFTEDDYQAHRLEVQQGKEPAEEDSPDKKASPQSDGLQATEGQYNTLLVANKSGENHEEVTKCVRNKLKGHTGTMGPIPFLTFARSRIHNVEFGRDPRSSFYSLFQDPSKALMDMQYLRMFVRRYIVHTSQGNNPRHVPLRAFVTVRCACPDLDNDLLLSVTREEIGHLVKVNREIMRAKMKKNRRRQDVLETYRAPAGPFHGTGVLYLTHLPSQTMTVALLELIMVSVLAAYIGIVYSTAKVGITAEYINQYLGHLCGTCVVCGLSAIVTVFHAIKMTVDWQRTLSIVIVRLFLSLGALACSLMVIIVLGKALSITHLRNFVLRGEILPNDMCEYYFTHSCSGFEVSCNADPYSSLCHCSESIGVFSTPCSGVVLGELIRSLIPILCFSFVVGVLAVTNIYLHYRLIRTCRMLRHSIRHGAGAAT